MPIDLTDLKPSPIPQKKPVFEDNKKCSYMGVLDKSDKVILDVYKIEEPLIYAVDRKIADTDLKKHQALKYFVLLK